MSRRGSSRGGRGGGGHNHVANGNANTSDIGGSVPGGTEDDDLVMGDMENILNQPPQNPAERRLIRSNYRQIITSLNENEHELSNPETGNLQQQLDKVEGIFHKVKHPREAVLDSHAMSRIAELGCRQAQALHTDFLQFDPADFSKRVLNFLSGSQDAENPAEDENQEGAVSSAGWEQLGKAVQAFFQRSPPLSLMFGSFEHGPPVKKKSDKPNKPKPDEEIVAQRKDPKELASFANAPKLESTTDEVDSIHKLLCRQYREWDESPTCYFEFVVNPESFGQTIENMFYVSFLVKDGHARIFLDQDNLPVIEPIDRDSESVTQTSGSDANQVVMSMTQADWKEIIEVFHITGTIIPTRKSN